MNWLPNWGGSETPSSGAPKTNSDGLAEHPTANVHIQNYRIKINGLQETTKSPWAIPFTGLKDGCNRGIVRRR